MRRLGLFAVALLLFVGLSAQKTTRQWEPLGGGSAGGGGTAGALLKANNLSDVASVPASRGNLRIDGFTNPGNAAYVMTGNEAWLSLRTTLTAARTVTVPSIASMLALGYADGHCIPASDDVEGGGISSTNTWSFARSSSDTINGSSSNFVANVPGEAFMLCMNGSGDWKIKFLATAAFSCDAWILTSGSNSIQILPASGCGSISGTVTSTTAPTTTFTPPFWISSNTAWYVEVIGASGGTGGCATGGQISSGSGAGGEAIVTGTGLAAASATSAVTLGFGGTAGSSTGPTAGGNGNSVSIVIGATTYTGGASSGSVACVSGPSTTAGGTATNGTQNITGDNGYTVTAGGAGALSLGGKSPYGTASTKVFAAAGAGAACAGIGAGSSGSFGASSSNGAAGCPGGIHISFRGN